jgi:4-amino-4-deoxy-L-arabinose transferase-like glycosyltransferase
MMLLSALAMVGFLALAWRYLVSHNYATQWQAVAIVTLAGVNWRMMTLATSIISEILFAFLIVATLHLAEKYEREQASPLGVVLGIVAGLTFLTRTSGLVVLIAVAVYWVLRRKWRRALLPVAVGSLFVVAWLGWCYLNRNTGGGEHASYYAGYMRGIDTTVGQLQALNHSTRITTHLKIIETNAVGLILVWMPLQSLGLRSSIPPAVLMPLLLSFVALLTAGLLREVRKGVRLLHIFLLFYVVLHLIVPSHSYERYLMPIVPFLLLLVVREFSSLFSIMRTAFTSSASYAKKAVPACIALVLAATASIPLFSNSAGIYLSLTNTKATVNSAEDARAFEWITANTNPSDVLVCFADQKYYLFTGRKAVRSIPVNILDLVVYQDQGPRDDELVKTFLNIVDENRGTYLVFGARDFEHQAPAYGNAIQSHLEQHPEQFIPEFRSVSGDAIIYRIQRGQVGVR